MDFHSQAEEIVKKMTLEQKIHLFSTPDLDWIEELKELGIPCARLAEGMSKLRLPGNESEGDIPELAPSIVFPSESLLASSFDEKLMEEIGNALGEECLENQVDLLLGPVVNVVRNPLRGNRERYLSEDPYLNGKLAAGFVRGIQKQGVGACLAYLGADSREYNRYVTNGIIDDKTFHEIYLKPFEIAVKEGNPVAIMTAPGKVNGVANTENSNLIRKVVRDNWGFQGVMLSHFGGMINPVNSLECGIDLELHGAGKEVEKEIQKAIKNKDLSEETLNESTVRMVTTLLKHLEAEKRSAMLLEASSDLSKLMERKRCVYDRSAHRRLTWRAAQESAVLLKNDGILPLKEKKNIAIIGSLAKYPRFSLQNASKEAKEAASPYQVLTEYGYSFGYADGYDLSGSDLNQELIEEACKVADGRELVIVFLGSPQPTKKERKSLLLPENQLKLLDAVLKKNKKVVVVIENEGIVRMPQLGKIGALLLMGIAGEQCGRACVNILSGQANPCGRLAETIPNSVRDIPSYHYHIAEPKREEYRESIFVGYRYYDHARKNVMFPFGYGLSYTTFAYGNLEIDQTTINFCDEPDRVIHLDLPITNTGNMDGKEVVQLYLRHLKTGKIKEDKVLKGFTKILIPQKEERMASFELTYEDFMTYSNLHKCFVAESGKYEILIGSNSRNILKRVEVEVITQNKDTSNLLENGLEKNKRLFPTYMNCPEREFQVPHEEFERLLQDQTISKFEERVVTMRTPLKEICNSFWGNVIVKTIKKRVFSQEKQEKFYELMDVEERIMDMPIYTVCTLYCNLSRRKVSGYVDICNHKFFKGIRKIL